MIKKIVTDIQALRKASIPVGQDEDVKELIQDLKDTTINCKRSWGLSANQIGVLKKVSYIRMPSQIDPKTKEIKYFELVMINPKIIEKDKKVEVKREECLSLPGLYINTDRWVFITLEYEDEQRQKQTALLQDMEALCIQHEYDHTIGLILLDKKHRSK
jgi:peptide deformylase